MDGVSAADRGGPCAPVVEEWSALPAVRCGLWIVAEARRRYRRVPADVWCRLGADTARQPEDDGQRHQREGGACGEHRAVAERGAILSGFLISGG
jgi:hypothetical protein